MSNGSKSPGPEVEKTPEGEVTHELKVNGVEVGTRPTGSGATTYLNTILTQMIAKQKANKTSKVTRHE
jgi:hypothetical protein